MHVFSLFAFTKEGGATISATIRGEPLIIYILCRRIHPFLLEKKYVLIN